MARHMRPCSMEAGGGGGGGGGGGAHASMSMSGAATGTPRRQCSIALPMPAADEKVPTTQKVASAAARQLPVAAFSATNTTASARPSPACTGEQLREL